MRLDLDAFRSLRWQSGHSQSSLAREVGVSRSAINQIERGRNTPTPSLVAKLTDALGCTFDDLMTDEAVGS